MKRFEVLEDLFGRMCKELVEKSDMKGLEAKLTKPPLDGGEALSPLHRESAARCWGVEGKPLRVGYTLIELDPSGAKKVNPAPGLASLAQGFAIAYARQRYFPPSTTCKALENRFHEIQQAATTLARLCSSLPPEASGLLQEVAISAGGAPSPGWRACRGGQWFKGILEMNPDGQSASVPEDTGAGIEELYALAGLAEQLGALAGAIKAERARQKTSFFRPLTDLPGALTTAVAECLARNGCPREHVLPIVQVILFHLAPGKDWGLEAGQQAYRRWCKAHPA
ncbi:hypothetical protein [Holophaga foetida]|uniref:hypothetical protein n=1 Tax=Holophaga foetida TaxID=35839 RepID=UPI0002473B53|nr:hypothetical protein [Holophaga foetida]